MVKKLLIFILTFLSTAYDFDIKKYEPKQITTVSSKESDIVIKDDNTIYFSSGRTGNFDVYKKDLLKETVTQITFQPSNEYPKYFDGKILMESDETDIYGNIYYLTEKGSQELLYQGIGKENNPFVKDGIMYFSRENRDGISFRHYDIKKKKNPKLIKGNVGKKALLSGKDELIYESAGDTYSFNNLFLSKFDNNELKDSVQITYGQKILNGFDVSKDGKTVIYSAVTTDTNGDTRLDLNDNSILYRIERIDESFSDPIQLTSESYSSFDPKISPDGTIYFISGRKGNDDVWSCGQDGVVPLKNNQKEQKELSDYLFENYKAQILLSEASGGKISDETTELLANALLSFNRTISFSDQSDAQKSETYFKIAEIYEIQRKYRSAESIYRIIQSRFQNDEDISGAAELKRASAELLRKEISTNQYGYELDEHVRYLNSLTEKYKSENIRNLIFLRIGEIYYNLERFTTANSYFIKAKTGTDGRENPESYFWQAKTAFSMENIQSAGILLERAIKLSESYDQKEKYIREYFAFSKENQSDDIERITQTIHNENMPDELRSYSNLALADILTDQDQKIESYNKVKKYFVAEPENQLLKKFSAQSDIKLSKLYIKSGPEEAVEAILKYMIENYRGINYDLYSILAQKTLSEIYLKKAKDFLTKRMNDNALLTYSKAYELDKKNIEVIRGIVESYNNLKKTDEAIRFFNREYQTNANNAYFNYALGYSYSVRATGGNKVNKADITAAVKLLSRSIEIDGNIKYSYLTLAFCYEALYHINLTESDNEKNKNVVLKGLDFVVGPLKFLLETVNILEDTSADYTDLAISLLGKGIGLCDKAADKELYLKMKLNLANNYYNMGEFARKQALDYYKQIIEEGYKFSSKKQEAVIYERAGHCLFTLDDESAEEYYSKAIAIYKELNDRNSELRVSMRTALLYLTREDKEGDMIGGDDAYQKYAEIIVKLKSEDNKEAINLIKRNSAFAKFVDEEYLFSSDMLNQILSQDGDYKDKVSMDNLIILSLLGLNIPVWKLELILGSQYSDGFEGKDELALLYSIQASSYYNLKDFDTVKEILRQKADIFRKKGNDLALSLIENRLGIIEYLRSNWNESIKRFEKSNELCMKLNLYNVALSNENNILKAKIRAFGSTEISKVNQAVADTTIYSKAKATADLIDQAVNLNLRGVLSFKSYKKLYKGDPSEKYKAVRHLINSKKYFEKADSLVNSQTRTNEAKNRFSASVLYNLAISEVESGDMESASATLKRGKDIADLTYDKLLHWRYSMKSGDLETDPEIKLGLYKKAEEILSEYLPSTADYELITGWKEDIKPLYDRIIEGYLQKKDIMTAFNYAERFKNRTLLNYYSSRYLEYKEQLHKIHVKKIRYNNEEIVRYRQKADLLKNKNAKKYAKLIAEYEKQAEFYESELIDIYGQIKKANDERLLQFVSIEDIDREKVSEVLGEYKGVISIYSLPDAELYFYFDQNGVKYSRTPALSFNKIFDEFTSEIEEKEQIFIIPDIDESINVNYPKVSKEKGLEAVNFTILPTMSSLRMVTENANINYSELKIASETGADREDISSLLENGGIIFIDRPIEISGSNSLENIFEFGKTRVKLGELLRLKIPAYAVVISGFEGHAEPIDKILLANSFIFSGVQTIIMPFDDQKDSVNYETVSKILFENSDEKDIIAILNENNISVNIVGLTGMDKETQKEFATSNLKSSLMNGVRYFNSKVYEKAAVYFLQALAMARNINDKQELNILKTLVTSLSRIKDYNRAIIYGEQLVSYTEANKLDKERILAYDTLSKDYFRNKNYDRSIEYQEKIINDDNSELKDELSAYDMLSIIYSYKGDLKRSISYKKEYLKSSNLITSDEIDSFKEELGGKAAEVLFNSLRNIMVNYYREGSIDSALFVYDSIVMNKETFENVSFDSFGELLESAGLCYFKKSLYTKAEELYLEALDYYSDEAKKSSAYLNLSDLYYFTDKLSSALKYLNEAEKNTTSDSERMRIFNTRSLTEVKLGNLPLARTFSYKALDKTIEMNDRSEESTARVNLAKILILTNDISGAQKNLAKSMELAVETKNIKAMLSVEFYKGEIYSKNLKNPDSALINYRKCLKLSTSDNDEYFKARALYGIGASFYTKQQNDSCEFYLLKSLEGSDKFGFNDIYLKSVYKLSEVYEKNQSEKALNMLDKLSQRAEKIAAEYENQFADEYEKIIRSGFEKQIYLLIKNSRIDKALSAIEYRDKMFIRNDLKYFGIKEKEKYRLNIKAGENILTDIQSGIKSESVMMLFLPYNDLANIIVVTKDNVKNFEFRIPKELSELPNRIETKSDFINLAKKSYEIIFTKELKDLIQDKKNIHVYSSGKLKNYPFDVLYDGKDFLIDNYNISEVSDISKLNFNFGTGDIAKSMSFVNPFTAESDLVFAEREFGALSQVNKNSSSADDKKATESLVKSQGMKEYGMLHLPVHSFVLSKDSVRTADKSSYIQLSADGSNDGRLEWGEIVQLDCKQKEVILSGCDTGGKIGQEYYSNFDLSQAFALAGSDIIVSSKWKTDDLAASVLMKRYFRYSAGGSDRITALSQAKRDIKSYFNPHPYYWANFKINR